jgi:hypothetical protein
MESVEKWLKAKAVLRVARKEALNSIDLTEDGLKELADAAEKELSEYGGEYETEDGVAYLNPVYAFAHKNSLPLGMRYEIKSRRKE